MLTQEQIELLIKKLSRQTKTKRVVWLRRDGDYRTTILECRFRLSVFNGHIQLSILNNYDVSAYDIIKPQYFLTELYNCIKRQVVETDKGIEDWVESILAKDNFFRKITTKVNSIVRIIKPENKSYD